MSLPSAPPASRTTALAPAARRLAEPAPSIRRSITRRFVDQPPWAIVTELFIGLGWARAAVAKVIDPAWWRGDDLRTFLIEHEATTLAWYQPVIDNVIAPNLVVVSMAVLVLQAVTAVCLLGGSVIGRSARTVGIGLGMAMNLHFVAAGAVNPSAFYLLAQGALALWMIEQWSARRQRVVLPALAAAGVALVGFSLPFVSTLHPADVIDDPAIMLATVGGLTALAAELTLIRSRPDASADGDVEALGDDGS